MTAYTDPQFPSKKALKEALAQGRDITLIDPNPWGEDLFIIQAGKLAAVKRIGQAPGQPPEDINGLAVTNHPKRSWFGQIRVKPDGTITLK